MKNTQQSEGEGEGGEVIHLMTAAGRVTRSLSGVSSDFIHRTVQQHFNRTWGLLGVSEPLMPRLASILEQHLIGCLKRATIERQQYDWLCRWLLTYVQMHALTTDVTSERLALIATTINGDHEQFKSSLKLAFHRRPDLCDPYRCALQRLGLEAASTRKNGGGLQADSYNVQVFLDAFGLLWLALYEQHETSDDIDVGLQTEVDLGEAIEIEGQPEEPLPPEVPKLPEARLRLVINNDVR